MFSSEHPWLRPTSVEGWPDSTPSDNGDDDDNDEFDNVLQASTSPAVASGEAKAGYQNTCTRAMQNLG